MSNVPGGLGELPAAVGPSDHQQQQINDRWNTYSQTENHMASALGIHPLPLPMFGVPEVTVELLRGLNDSQYMEVYNAHDAWNSFVTETMSQVQNIILQIENEIDDIAIHLEEQLKATAKMEGKKPTTDDIKWTIKSHPRIRFLKIELQRQKQLESRLTARQKTLSRAERLLSRNIELIKSQRESANGGPGMQRRASGDLPPRFT
jgi:hypothetical protein